jgi:TRAP-type C4-dicarboxylate transport system permease small subunit
MQTVVRIVSKLSRWVRVIAGAALTFMILMTVADVILRSFRRPIRGTYELVGLSGAVIFAFSLPITSWLKGHVCVDFVILKFPQPARNALNIVTKCLGMGLFLLMGSNLMILGMEIYRAGEMSPTLHVPFYPIIYAIGICCYFQCLVLLCDIMKSFGGKYD